MINRAENEKKGVRLGSSEISNISPVKINVTVNYGESLPLTDNEKLEATGLLLQEARLAYVNKDHEELSAFGNIMKVLGLKNKERPENAKNSFQYQKYRRIWNEFLDLNIQTYKNKQAEAGVADLKKEIAGLMTYLQIKESLILIELRLDERMGRIGDVATGLRDKLKLEIGVALPEIFQQKKKKEYLVKPTLEAKLVDDVPGEKEEKEEGLWHMLERLGGSELVDLISEARGASGEDFNMTYRKIFHSIISNIHQEHEGDLRELGERDAKEYISTGQIGNSKIEILAEFARKHMNNGFMEAKGGENMKEWIARMSGMLILKLCEDKNESSSNQDEV